MKKKMIATITTVSLVAGMLLGCGSKEVSIDAKALASQLVSDIEYTTELSELSSEDIANYIDMEDGVEGIMYMSSGSTAEEVMVFTAPDEKTAQTMKANVEQFLADQKDSFQDYIPEEAKRIEDGVVTQKGKYVAGCISGDSDQATKIMNQTFGE